MNRFSKYLFDTNKYMRFLIVFVISFFMSMIFVYIVYLIASLFQTVNPINRTLVIVGVVLSSFISLFTSLTISSVVWGWKIQDRFDKALKETEEKIENAETIKELKEVYDNDWQRLVKMTGGFTKNEYNVSRLLTIMTTKSKYLK